MRLKGCFGKDDLRGGGGSLLGFSVDRIRLEKKGAGGGGVHYIGHVIQEDLTDRVSVCLGIAYLAQMAFAGVQIDDAQPHSRRHPPRLRYSADYPRATANC